MPCGRRGHGCETYSAATALYNLTFRNMVFAETESPDRLHDVERMKVASVGVGVRDQGKLLVVRSAFGA